MVIYVDIDDTICESDKKGLDYNKSSPIKERISKINDLYASGNTIIYWTGRGTLTGVDWREVTLRQLEEWGARHHGLVMGKPAFDLFIDDKNINSEEFFKDVK
jgi:hypothetical protein|tara:strand:+ start:407 stop:715 length:309 start_codon:yes stop_codon:yes gene_type:complete